MSKGPTLSDRCICPKCESDCTRESVDVGVGIQCGPWGCSTCGWSEYSEYDLSEGRYPIDEKGGVLDQFGVYYPPGNPVASGYKLAKLMEEKDKK